MARKNPEMDFKNAKKYFCPPSFISRYLLPSMWNVHKNQECGKLSVKLYEHQGFKNNIFYNCGDFLKNTQQLHSSIIYATCIRLPPNFLAC